VRAVREERRTAVVGADRVARRRVERGHHRALGHGVRRGAGRAAGVPGGRGLELASGGRPVESARGPALARAAAARGDRVGARFLDDAAAAITGASGQRLGKRQVEALARAAALDVETFYAGTAPEAADSQVVLVLSFDGKGIVMLPGALREATARSAAVNRKKLATRLSPGEKNGRKRMAELAAVYDAVPRVRSPADIIGRAGGATRRRGPAATGKWLTASVAAGIRKVIAAGFDEAERRDPHHQRTQVVLVDGNRTQIEGVRGRSRPPPGNAAYRVRLHPRARIPPESRLELLRDRRRRR